MLWLLNYKFPLNIQQKITIVGHSDRLPCHKIRRNQNYLMKHVDSHLMWWNSRLRSKIAARIHVFSMHPCKICSAADNQLAKSYTALPLMMGGGACSPNAFDPFWSWTNAAAAQNVGTRARCISALVKCIRSLYTRPYFPTFDYITKHTPPRLKAKRPKIANCYKGTIISIAIDRLEALE